MAKKSRSWSGIRDVRDLFDPGSGMKKLGSEIRGSGINILDPQPCPKQMLIFKSGLHFDANPNPASQNDVEFSKKTWISGWLRWRRF
jgi:hypothetical protein